MRRVVVVAYDSLWPTMYEQEAARIATVFGDELLCTHHIGSTAVPGMWAKPIIDIMPIVRDIAMVDLFDEAMMALGYEPKGENNIPGRRFFRKGGDINRSHHVHAYEAHNPEVGKHLDLRDYLRAHPYRAELYGELKRALASRFPDDIGEYIQGKDAFVQETIQLARAWRAGM